ncbi:hypothetical protein HOD05_03050 [Candidatus Woesearchaeota archaeon]|jgi:hypothetical protein|nr:hypothetical protein [Candidatus Woesearchaeota archaeon]MBT4151351.1 hypothetical protein [Candidatus Woesearchaeota archaeon]MBT4247749.1 hypothetical protein [Candidatus Woesearchaeota archaeon]MBT4434173.1 hypothetical protein [Candidatus Woesearchaeota archaeon]MBT7332490.1 hypothetical protein [Candidatus Woesearchaeota archaeon]
MFKNKKGNIALIAIILALVILGYMLTTFALRDCNNNTDCAENAYCGSDYECHAYPDEIVYKQNNFVPASLILGISLILAAYLFRTSKIPFKKY